MLTERLRTLEDRLKYLFEEQLTHLLPSDTSRARLQAQLVASLKVALAQSGGSIPRKLRVDVPLPLAAHYRQNPSLHHALVQILHQAIQESGLECPMLPQIEVIGDPSLPGEGIHLTIPETGPLEETDAYPSLPDEMPYPSFSSGKAFLIVGGKQTYLLTKTITNIGRRPDNDLMINDPRVSRVHAQLRAEQGKYYLFDLNSTGGTFINGRRILQQPLHPGDVISLAGYPLVFGVETEDNIDHTQEYKPPVT